MLGHELSRGLRPLHDLRVTVRRHVDSYRDLGLFDAVTAYGDVDVRSLDSLSAVLADFHPEVIINAAGIVKQRAEAKQAVPSIQVNALFPHQLASLAGLVGSRVVHVSTDCVFSGQRGDYTEADTPDPVDLYGLTKLLGELDGEGCVTLRTSIIGLERAGRQGLVEWALAQKGVIPGYRRARYSGLTTMELTRVIDRVITRHPDMQGVWHVASEPISKLELLAGLLKKLDRVDVDLVADDAFSCDRTLGAARFEEATGYRPMAWDVMLDELVERIRQREQGPE